MEKLKEIVAYFCSKYPYPKELSKARLVKMLYLADWKSSITNFQQLSDTKWIYNNYGPYVNDIVENLKRDPSFEVLDETNSHGTPKQIIRLNHSYESNLKQEDKIILDFVIKATSPLNYSEFIDLVYSTYPIKVSSKKSELNLVELAKDYKKNKDGDVV